MSKGKIVWNLVWKIIWLIVKVVLWGLGLVAFISAFQNNPEMDTFSCFLTGWLVWGVLCAIAILRETLGRAFGQSKTQARKGAKRGANTYTIDSHGTVENHPLSGRILGFIGGFIGGILGGVIAGPVVVPIRMVWNIKDIVKYSKELKAEKAETKE